MNILQFQELFYITQQKDNDLDKSIKMVGVVTGLTPEQVDKIPMVKFNKLCKFITKQFTILEKNVLKTTPLKGVRVNGRSYSLHYRVDRKPINAGKYVEAVEFGKDVIGNLHKIMATIAEPVRWSWKKWKFVPYERDHVDIATDMEKIPFEAAYHAAVFFYTHYQVSMILIRPYLVKELVRKGVPREEAIRTLTDLSTTLDGLQMPRWSLNLKEYLLNRYGTSELSIS